MNPTGGDSYGGLNDDLRLAPSSPLIDSGNNGGMLLDIGDLDEDGNTLEFTPIDLDHMPRRMDNPLTTDTGNGTQPVVDRGAYEFVPYVPQLGDMDCNGVVEIADAPIMAMALTNEQQYNSVYGCIENGDVNQDSVVNAADLQGFVELLMN
ncbi:MAG: hypothetical protein IPK83_03260 [Planctomycetes bacterium]|nr:hypothetical protein [Planctomycetota bacterium]